ncbi:unnamed protein product [Anisakis simplex]|uniref:DUF58 domain-containing protein n=1 Tax=Anisakis simplex TaxID=6269 RepID=A0A0M3JR20_ANISI|nr:unnamed protein product [Anisakis simplex]
MDLDNGVLAIPDTILFSNSKVICAPDVRRVVDYCGSPTDGYGTCSSVHSKFRFINNKDDLKRLREFEKNQISIVDRRSDIKALSVKLKEMVIERM